MASEANCSIDVHSIDYEVSSIVIGITKKSFCLNVEVFSYTKEEEHIKFNFLRHYVGVVCHNFMSVVKILEVNVSFDPMSKKSVSSSEILNLTAKCQL